VKEVLVLVAAEGLESRKIGARWCGVRRGAMWQSWKLTCRLGSGFGILGGGWKMENVRSLRLYGMHHNFNAAVKM